MLHRAAKNAYSWWWASHIRTKQSKWLDQNLQDMEEKVEYILKIINEDGDSFAVRAEMYYRKRPEIVNFVEDCFRGYRALAERYDHLSRDLQSANRAIATVYPEISMDEEEEEDFIYAPPPPAFQETEKPSKTPPAVPKSIIPKIQKLPKKNSKLPSRLMSKKALITKSCGLSKEEALEEIDKLQKDILGLQTEKEFVKSSYENGLSKYWEIENQVTEMQGNVSSLQDEFGIGTVIEDDEARALISATALNSCQEALVKMREKQRESNEEARIEYQRVQEAREKFETLKEKHISKCESTKSPNLKNLDQQVENIEEKKENIKEELFPNSLTVSELAEKIEELVDKVINLETEVSSQTAFVMRLRTETDELHSHLQTLEEDKEILIEGSNSKSNKIRELEEELGRVQSLNQRVKDKNEKLKTRFEEASCNLDQVSQNLSSVKPDEEVQNAVFFKQVKSEEEMNKILDCITFLKAEAEKSSKTKKSDHLDDVGQVKADIEDNNPGKRLKENEDSKALAYDSKISKNARMEEQVKNYKEKGVEEHQVLVPKEMNVEEERSADYFFKHHPYKAQEYNQYVQSSVHNQSYDLSLESDVRSVVMGANIEKGFNIRERKIDYILGQDPLKPETCNQLDHPLQNVQVEKLSGKGQENQVLSKIVDTEERELSKDEEDQPNWREMFLFGLEDREKMILEEYNSTLRNYKEVRKKLSEVEKRNRASLFKSAVQIKVLRNSNASKDAEIQSLHEKLILFQTNIDKDKTPDTQEKRMGRDLDPSKDAEIESLYENPNLFQTNRDFKVPDIQESTSKDLKAKKVLNLSDTEKVVESLERKEDEDDDFMKLISIDEPPRVVSGIEEKIRMDIDDLLEENIEVWLRFSNSFNQIQKFQTSIQDLKAELKEVRDKSIQDGKQSLGSDLRPIYRHLRDMQTELTLWLENNGALKEDLQHRLSSLFNIQEEITRLSNAGPKEEQTELSNYHAARFQGEILNMKQESKKVAEELRVGGERVKKLRIDIERTLEKLDEELRKNRPASKNINPVAQSRIPLRSFLFGVKLRKHKPSFFACMSPALQKQYSDLTSFPT